MRLQILNIALRQTPKADTEIMDTDKYQVPECELKLQGGILDSKERQFAMVTSSDGSPDIEPTSQKKKKKITETVKMISARVNTLHTNSPLTRVNKGDRIILHLYSF